MASIRDISIRTKIVAIITSISAITVLLTLFFSISNQVYTHKKDLTNELTQEVSLLADYCVMPIEYNYPDRLEELLLNARKNESVIFIAVSDTVGDIISSQPKDSIPDLLFLQLNVEGKGFNSELFQINHVIKHNEKSYGYISILYNTGLNKKILKNALGGGIAFITITLLSFLLAMHFQKYISKPVLDLAQVASKVSRDKDYTIRIPGKSSDEVGVLYEKFNEMLGTINEQYKFQEKATAALAHSEEKFRNIFNYSLDGILLTANDGIIQEASDMACKIFMLPRDKVVGESMLNIMPQSYSNQRKDAIKVLATEGKITFFSKYKTPEGQDIFLEFTSTLIDYEGIELNLSFIRDITGRIRSEEALRESEARYRKLIDNIPSAIILHRNNKILIVNNAVKSILGAVTKNEFHGTSILDYIHLSHINLIEDHFKEVKENDEVSSAMEVIMNRVDSKKIVVEIISIPLIVDRKPTILTVFNDITERKKIEKELIVAKNKAEESDKLKSAFLANMSHEIRTPMNGIIGFTDLLGKDNIKPEDIKRYVKIIQSSADRLLNIINDIIDISKIESGAINVSYAEFNLTDLLKEQQMFFQPTVESKGIKLIFDLKTDKEIVINSDEVKINQVISNLISNALKFTREGSIKVIAGIDEEDKIVKVSVEDTGIGIPKDQLKKIFERFRQVKNFSQDFNEGTGLGLSISKGFIEALGGNITVNSVVGKGTRFQFTLPLARIGKILKEVEMPVMDLPLKPKKIDYSGKTILVVEDEINNFKYLKEIIEPTHAEIIWADNGLVAVQKVIEENRIDLVLMDIKLPLIDGYTATRKIKNIRYDLPVIIQTAFALEGDKRKTMNIGCDDYIAKPIKGDDLLTMINKYFMKKEKAEK